jgi:hypothetical protein
MTMWLLQQRPSARRSIAKRETSEETLVNTSSYLRLTELEVPYVMIHPDVTEAESGSYPYSPGCSYRRAETGPSLEARYATPRQMP